MRDPNTEQTQLLLREFDRSCKVSWNLELQGNVIYVTRTCLRAVWIITISLGSDNVRSSVQLLGHWLKPGLHYQSFCDHSRNFASVNSKFSVNSSRWFMKGLSEIFEGTDSVFNIKSVRLKQWVSSLKHFLQILHSVKPALTNTDSDW